VSVSGRVSGCIGPGIWCGGGLGCELEYLGRVDERSSCAGSEIELGEIEAVLAAQPGVVSGCGWLVREDRPGDRRWSGMWYPRRAVRVVRWIRLGFGPRWARHCRDTWCRPAVGGD
jgi:hypothetical protein